MSLREFAAQIVHATTDATILYECRQCGTTLSADATTCPACGSDEIAEYEF